jgi:hypothetical protein
MPLQLEQWDDAIGPELVLADDRRRGDDLSPHEFALRDRQLARRRVEIPCRNQERCKPVPGSGIGRVCRCRTSDGSPNVSATTDRMVLIFLTLRCVRRDSG